MKLIQLRLALLGLLPLLIAEFKNTTFEERRDPAAADAQTIASRADQLMFPDPKAKLSGVLTSIARGLAIGAYQPGGITVLGIHACVYAHPHCPATPGERPSCCTCDPGQCATGTGRACPQECSWCANGCSTDGACCPPPCPLGRIFIVEK
ncbi:hypothetical protein ACQPYK_49610 (plasmid) [Streptosporangium sp. CA-135522]|uniref:hypothetical protein n=1 Tax=Streptosporangium sp. CA-135522 TaxID=3240072 RepID=UPI003D8BDA86